MTVLRVGGVHGISTFNPSEGMSLEVPDGARVKLHDTHADHFSPRGDEEQYTNGYSAFPDSSEMLSYVSDWQLKVAQAYVSDACKGRPPHIRIQHNDHFLKIFGTPLQMYQFVHHRYWRWFMSFIITLQLALGFFEHNDNYRTACTIIELVIIVIALIDVSIRLYSHDDHPHKGLHAIYQSQSEMNKNAFPNTIISHPSTTPNHRPKDTTTPLFQPIPVFQSHKSPNNSLPSLSLSSTAPYTACSSPLRPHHDPNEPLSYQEFYKHRAYYSQLLQTHPDYQKHAAELSNSQHIAYKQLPSIEKPMKHRNFIKRSIPSFTWSRLRIFLLLLTLLDIVATVCFGFQLGRFYRITRLIRPFFFLEKGRVLRQLVTAVARTIPSILEVVVLIALTITTFSLAGFFLFSKKGLDIGSNDFFSSIENSMFSMTVLMTTANFPDVMMSSFTAFTPSALFFMLFLLIALYLLFNVILSAVYARFQLEAYRLLHTIPLTQLYALTSAFELLSRPSKMHVIPPSMVPPDLLDMQYNTPPTSPNTYNPNTIDINTSITDLCNGSSVSVPSTSSTETVQDHIPTQNTVPYPQYHSSKQPIPLATFSNSQKNNDNCTPSQQPPPTNSNLEATLIKQSYFDKSDTFGSIPQSNTRRFVEKQYFENHPDKSPQCGDTVPFTAYKKQSWLYLMNLGYTQHSQVIAYEQYKTYLKLHHPDQYRRILSLNAEAGVGPFDCSCQDVISQDTFLRLLQQTRPDLTLQQQILLFEALDQQHHHHIHIHEWFAFADFIDVNFISADYKTQKQQLSIAPHNIPESMPSVMKTIGKVLCSSAFNLLIDLFAMVHFCVLLFQLEEHNDEGTWNNIMDYFNVVLVVIYSIEYFFKLALFGPKRLYKSLLCSYELLLIFFTYGVYIVLYFGLVDYFTTGSLTLTSADLLAFRAIRIYRHLYKFPRFRAIILTLRRLYPALRSLFVILVSEYYFFGLLGVCLYKDVIVKGQMSDEFMNTYWAQNNYWENNFNDLYHAYVVLFEIMIINNWNLNIEGWTVALQSHWPRVYFVCHFFLAIIIILNCVIALVLDAFIGKYSSQETKEDERRTKEYNQEQQRLINEARNRNGEYVLPSKQSAPTTVKELQRKEKQKTQKAQLPRHLSTHTTNVSAPNEGSEPLIGANSSVSDSMSYDEYIMIDDADAILPYSISDDESSDDEGQQLVLTLIKRADHEHTIHNDSRDELTPSVTYLNNPENQQRIVFKRRTQRMYQMIFDK